MYLGGALILLATPFALGSEWAFPWAIAAVACLAWRLVEEESTCRRTCRAIMTHTASTLATG
jgi:protein-S-isoprenylcysteine O-methyltransferase Ste14